MLSLCLIIPMPLLNLIYIALNCDHKAARNLTTNMDRMIPFLKIFVLPYVGWYVFIVFTIFYFCLKDKETYYKILISLYLGLMICYGVYYFYQTTVPRPVLVEKDFLTQIIAQVYRLDQPFNCFPSIHSLTSYLMYKGIRHCPAATRLSRLAISGMAFVIILSTLFIKQHVILDAIAAVLLAEILFNLADTVLAVVRKTPYPVTISAKNKAKYVVERSQ